LRVPSRPGSRWRPSTTGQRSSKPRIARHGNDLRSARSHRRMGIRRSRALPPTPTAPVAEGNAELISFRLSTVVRAGIAAIVLGALGIGFAVGLVISSSPSQTRSAGKVVTDASTVSVPSGSTITTAVSPATLAASPPTVVSCRPGSAPQVRPTTIEIGCLGGIAISNVTWSSWGSSTGSGSGTLTVNSCRPNCAAGVVSSSAAFVVISDPVRGVFQHVLITPPTGAVPPQSSAHPGSGWGSG